MKIPSSIYLYGGAAAAGLGLIWWATRAGNAQKLAQGGVRVAGEVATGAVKGVGQVLGIPDTNKTQCQQDLAAGRYWDASFSCPAGDYVAGIGGQAKQAVFGSTAAAEAAKAEVNQAVDAQLEDLTNYNYF